MMTREDVLRELELLPVWQLRVPLLEIEKVPEQLTEKVAEKITETAPELLAIAEVAPATEISQKSFEMHISDDKNWLFICPASRMDAGSQSMLFNNILSALHINKVHIYTQDLATAEVKIIVVMGEKTAQTLLNTLESIANLRSKEHALHNTPLIVTYSCDEMLDNLQNKAKTWDDLLTALKILVL
jgi:uracil-DNA glycosylase